MTDAELSLRHMLRLRQFAMELDSIADDMRDPEAAANVRADADAIRDLIVNQELMQERAQEAEDQALYERRVGRIGHVAAWLEGRP